MSSDLVALFRRAVRGGTEQQQLSDLSSLLASVSISPVPDRWVCSLASDGSFRVRDVRNAIDDLPLPSFSEATSFGLMDHIDETTRATDSKWKKLNSLVKVWLYGTLSTSLLQMVLKKNATAESV
ncbi:hypothetical protein Tco_0602346 [Tanacetum coccineum]